VGAGLRIASVRLERSAKAGALSDDKANAPHEDANPGQ